MRLAGPSPHHGGKAVTTSTAKLAVGGKQVLVAASLGAIASCANSAPGEIKCTKVLTIIAGNATKLTVAGSPVLLDTLKGTTNGNPVGALAATAGQLTLTAV